MNKSAEIRRLLNLKTKPRDIAKKLKVNVNLVYQVGWAMRKAKKQTPVYKKKTKQSKIVKAVTEMKQALDVIESKPTKLLVQPQYKDAAMKILADNDLVNKPPHYTAGGVDFLDYAEAKGLTENAYLFNVVKYISRAGKKLGVDPVQDLEKAEFYLKREIARRKQA